MPEAPGRGRPKAAGIRNPCGTASASPAERGREEEVAGVLRRGRGIWSTPLRRPTEQAAGACGRSPFCFWAMPAKGSQQHPASTEPLRSAGKPRAGLGMVG